MTEDLNTVGNDEVYIVLMEDSATLTTEGTDDDAAEDGVMTLGSVNENDQYLVITDPAALPFRVRSSLYSNIVIIIIIIIVVQFSHTR
mmetsp:Transcript_38580/g.41855  ORF Transcript_38580/g.41855 Transcript_38580/m.41855 type:complete len:88 (-) Transcript_38580:76-339(-)